MLNSEVTSLCSHIHLNVKFAESFKGHSIFVNTYLPGLCRKEMEFTALLMRYLSIYMGRFTLSFSSSLLIHVQGYASVGGKNHKRDFPIYKLYDASFSTINKALSCHLGKGTR